MGWNFSPAWEMAGLHAKGLFTKLGGAAGLGLTPTSFPLLLPDSSAIPGSLPRGQVRSVPRRSFKRTPGLAQPHRMQEGLATFLSTK